MSYPSPQPLSQGFTLIEILISVAIIGLLTAYAYPAYNDYSARGRMAEGVSILSNIRLMTEQNYLDTRSYADATSPCKTAPPTNKYFIFACSNVTATTYTWKATSKANVGLGSTSAYVYSVNENGSKKTLAYKGSSININCWQTSKSSAC